MTAATTVTNGAAVRRLVVGMTNRVYAAQYGEPVAYDASPGANDAYIEAAHIGLHALGADVPPAPFGLFLIVRDAVVAAGRRPAATAPAALATWRANLTDAILAAIGVQP